MCAIPWAFRQSLPKQPGTQILVPAIRKDYHNITLVDFFAELYDQTGRGEITIIEKKYADQIEQHLNKKFLNPQYVKYLIQNT